jgi:hypothetical protein
VRIARIERSGTIIIVCIALSESVLHQLRVDQFPLRLRNFSTIHLEVLRPSSQIGSEDPSEPTKFPDYGEFRVTAFTFPPNQVGESSNSSYILPSKHKVFVSDDDSPRDRETDSQDQRRIENNADRA